jgi:hypothetical protein
VITCIVFDADDLVLTPGAPHDARPARVTVATVVPGIVDAPRHESMVTLSFTDHDHLHRYLAWSGIGRRDDVTVTDDHVVRGAEWLEQRWVRGGSAFKHVAVAHRADGLTLGEMLERWSNHGGTVQRPGESATTIPEDVRGLAYVQQHPRVEGDHAWPYDAITQVWFDDLEALQARADWFASGPGSGPQALFQQSWFLALREDVLS